MIKCHDCKEEFDDDDLICVGSAQTVDECTLEGCQDNGCPEVYCEECFDED